ncbi:MAG TPA: site-2 protease family protein [Thermoplasmata archaeon]|nr:site-2 protease family protein [Thermoplasmata archaeon]
MSALDDWTIFLVLVLLYAVVVFVLYRAGRFGADRSLSLFGPAVMIKTKRGRGALDRLGRFKTFWTAAGDLGIVLAALAMVTIVFVLILDAIVVSQIPASAAPTPQEALGIPGINPIIPIGYGLVALIIGVVLHELAHGVMARSQNIGVKTLGILWLVIPVGAFVEQDDEQMQKAPRRRRDRVAAAGVLANFALAILFFVLLSGVVSTGIQPNANGVGIAAVLPGTPAANASLSAGDIIVAINGTPTATTTALLNVLGNASPNETITVTYYSTGQHALIVTPITLTSEATYTKNAADRDHGFLGVQLLALTPAELKTTLAVPVESSSGPLVGTIEWIALPLVGLQPISGTVASWYHVSGPFASWDLNSFWILANLLYWLAWMNLLLGMSNALPLVPLDGGLLFRDFSASIAARFRKGWDEAHLERFAGQAALFSSLMVVALLLWQFIGPRL